MTPQELEIINFGIENGKKPDEVKAAIASYRQQTGYQRPSFDVEDNTQGQFSGTQGRLADVGQSSWKNITGAIKGEGQYAGETPLRRGVEATATAFSTVPRGAYAMAPEFARKGIDWVGEKVGKGFKAVTGALAETDLIKGAAGRVETDPTTGASRYVQNDLGMLEEGLGIAVSGSEIAGNILAAESVVTNLTKAGTYSTKAAQTLLKESDGVLSKIKAKNPTITSGNFITRAVNDARFNLSDIDPQVETVLKRSNFDEVNTYFQQARAAKANPAKNTPLEIAGQKAESAFDAIDEARKKAIEGKKKILNQVADERVPGNTINETMSAGIKRIEEKFGVKVDAKGNVTPVKGRTSTLDAKDTAFVKEYYAKLNSLGVSPTVKQVDDFVDWAQGQLYKQSKSMSKLEAASDPIIRELQATTGDLNGRLKNVVGNGYGEVNARVSTLIEMQDELSRALGADARKGGGLMKNLFSPTGGNTRRIFQQIYDETGIDLFKEATLAKFAMENVGDVRQASLLKQLDVATQAAAELDLTKPMSLYNWLKERADLDGQELANEIMRRYGKEAVDGTPTGVKTSANKKPLTPEEEATVQKLVERQGGSSNSSIPNYLKDNKQAGFVAGSQGRQVSRIEAVEGSIKDIETRLRRFDADGMSPNSTQYKNSLKERDKLYAILGKLT